MDNDSYKYTEVQVIDEDDYNAKQSDPMYGDLYIKSYPNVQFYNLSTPELSLLHCIFKLIPEWKIGYVDPSLWKQERKFEQDRIAVYDFMMNDMCDTFKCVIEWDTIENKVNFYEEAEDGINEDNTVQNYFDTDVFISRENLAQQVKISFSTDDIKTKLKVTGGDDLNIRDINIGQDYIMNLDYYHTVDWMGQELYDKYTEYKSLLSQKQIEYQATMKEWVGANNKYNDLMNAVPATKDVLMIGDKFKKLYCLYGQNMRAKKYAGDNFVYYDDFACTQVSNPQPTSESNFQVNEYYIINPNGQQQTLIKQLNIHKVYKDIDKIKNDNVLLTLKNKDGDSATIRIYYDKTAMAGIISSDMFKARDYYKYDTEKKIYIKAVEYDWQETYYGEYKVDCTITYASNGQRYVKSYDLLKWIKGELSVDQELSQLTGYTIKSIGTLGAYYCLVKDETDIANLQGYGVNLLKEKRDIYTEIFRTQTEGYMSSSDAKCIAQDEAPVDVVQGTKWLDTDSVPLKLYEYNNGWIDITDDDSLSTAADYARYIDNYNKLNSVQQVLMEKKLEADYYLNGVKLSQYLIKPYFYLQNIFYNIAKKYFSNENDGMVAITDEIFDSTIPMYTFNIKPTARAYDYRGDWIYYDDPKCTLESNPQPNGLTDFTSKIYYVILPIAEPKTYSIFLIDSVPHIAYRASRGANQIIMDSIKDSIVMEKFFANEWARLSPFIREDEFSDSNCALTGYESEEERTDICEELRRLAEKELKTLSQPSLEFSIDMANILAIPEFSAIKDKFALGNFVRVGIRDDYIKRARLLEINISFDDLSDFSAKFGNLVTTKSEIDKHADLMKQAIQAGKSVASNASNWQRAVNKSTALDKAISDGLKDSALAVGSTSGQKITWDERGILCRKSIDNESDVYDDEQMIITNNKMVYTTDNWKTSKGVFGSYQIGDNEYSGVLAEAVIGGYIKGSVLEGGSIKIGNNLDSFEVTEDGTVSIYTEGVKVDFSNSEIKKELININEQLSTTMTPEKIQLEFKSNLNNGIKGNIRATKWIDNITYYDDVSCQQEANPQPNADTDFINNVYYIKESMTFMFNVDGLTLSDSSSNISTNIDEDGMEVKINNSPVLVANSNGVDAKNLHATTYLIIGDGNGRSRFEDYGTDRTGCFWIGGV